MTAALFVTGITGTSLVLALFSEYFQLYRNDGTICPEQRVESDG